MNILRPRKAIWTFCAGLLAVLGFAPFSLFPVAVFALALLFRHFLREKNPRAAGRLGFAFGFGLFGAGVGWIYVALHDYGDMSFMLALPATALFVAVLALFPALAGYAQARFNAPDHIKLMLIMPATWVLAEWLRGLLFTGFPWLALGYAQVPHSPLAGYAPLFGAYGVSLALALSAGLLVLAVQRVAPSPSGGGLGRGRESRIKQILPLLALLFIWFGGAALRSVEWTQPQGEPLKVSLLQGNIPQEMKFREEALVNTMKSYGRLVLQSDARLIVLPETALPVLRQEVPEEYASILRDHARKNNGDILIGAFERERGQYYNSVFTLGTADSQSYRKSHLVPFGEFVPLRPALGWFINEVLNIPMGDLTSGGMTQEPLNVAGQKVAVNICYEDAFGEEIIRALPQATLLVNATNDAWYGDSHAAMQHNQLSQMRALETGRMMLRATNTGVTSVIGPDGRIQHILPQHREGMLTAMVQGYAGSTPYVRWGNAMVLGLVALMLAAAWRWRRR